MHPVSGHPEASEGWIGRRPMLAFVVLAYSISWALWGVSWMLGREESAVASALFVLGGFGPAAAALAVLRSTGGSISRWARRIVRWRVPLRYWLFALGFPALLFAGANLTLAALGEPVEWSLVGDRIGPYLGTFLVTLVFLGGQEEPGWRGYALPRLQERWSPVTATVVLGLVWGLWHLPLDGPLAPVVTVPLAFLYTWVYNRTGSVLMAILLHASITPTQDHLILLAEETHGITDAVMLAAYVAGALLLIVLSRGRLGFDPERNAAAMRA
jgi:membrane protease YdiL (CAAX protease family)